MSTIPWHDYYASESEPVFPLQCEPAEHDIDVFTFERQRGAVTAREQKPPHCHDYQEIIWVRSGSATHLLDDNWQEVRPGSLLIVPRGRVHRFSPAEMTQGYVIRFRDTFVPANSALFSHFSRSAHCLVPGEEIPVVEALFYVISEEHLRYSQGRTHVILPALEALFAKLAALRSCRDEVSQPLLSRHRLLEEFNLLVERHYRHRRVVGFYAQQLGISTRKMNEILRSVLGKTANEIIEERRILEAKRLALFSDLSIKEIAYELGYEEHSYFSRVFKKMAGCTPSEFKQKTVNG